MMRMMNPIITIFISLEQSLTYPFWMNLHLSRPVFLELSKAGNLG